MSAPYEVLAGPFTVWVAPTTTAFIDVSQTPSGAWVKLGTTGTKNYDDNGITCTLTPTYSTFTPAGGTGPRKVWRVTEELTVEFNLVDLSAAQFAKTMNGATVTAQLHGASVGGTSSVPLLQGDSVTLFSLMARGGSPAGDMGTDVWSSQFNVPIVYNAGTPALVFKKGEPASLACKFTALQDDTYGFGNYVIQTADPSPA